MNKIAIRLLSIQESKFLYNTNFDYSQLQEQSLKIEFSISTNTNIDKNLFHLEVSVKYLHQTTVLLEIGALFSFEIKPLSSVLITKNDKQSVSENLLMNMLNTAIGTLRGIMFLKIQNTALEKFILPLLPVDYITSLIKAQSE